MSSVFNQSIKILSVSHSLPVSARQKHAPQTSALCVCVCLCVLLSHHMSQLKRLQTNPNWHHIHRLLLQAGLWTTCTSEVKNNPQQSEPGTKKLSVWHFPLFTPASSVGLIHTPVVLSGRGPRLLRQSVDCKYQSGVHVFTLLDSENKDRGFDATTSV